jgi:hypothetical protein
LRSYNKLVSKPISYAHCSIMTNHTADLGFISRAMSRKSIENVHVEFAISLKTQSVTMPNHGAVCSPFVGVRSNYVKQPCCPGGRDVSCVANSTCNCSRTDYAANCSELPISLCPTNDHLNNTGGNGKMNGNKKRCASSCIVSVGRELKQSRYVPCRTGAQLEVRFRV